MLTSTTGRTRTKSLHRKPAHVHQTFLGTEGYTLIELAVVIVLIGVMLAFAVPKISSGVLADDLKAATRRLVGTIRTVRDKAVQEQQGYRLHFEAGSNRYWLESEAMTPEERVTAQAKGSELPGDVRFLDAYRMQPGREKEDTTAIHFSKKGYAEQAVIHLQNGAARSCTLVLSPFLATIKTYDEYRDVEQW